jgi:hypothetical protein
VTIGSYAGKSNHFGSNNTLLGDSTSENVSSGENNVTIGGLALQNTVHSQDNVTVGASAGQYMSYGERNTLVGIGAGRLSPHKKEVEFIQSIGSGGNDMTDTLNEMENLQNVTFVYDMVHVFRYTSFQNAVFERHTFAGVPFSFVSPTFVRKMT